MKIKSIDTPTEIEFEVDGSVIKARKGETIAEALLNKGITIFRKTRNNMPRGVYCNMGICYECRMIVNGIPNVRSCMTLATPGCSIATQDDSRITLEK